ncbi:MAG: hypothetical protein JSW54_08575 [Fidelibacterota bacterium]|nr:MAG: hypothetical protein JSW54_08575 [Candidatus Neomarinimicrobiota bacterium]
MSSSLVPRFPFLWILVLVPPLYFGCEWFTQPEGRAEGSSDLGLYVRQTFDGGFILVGETTDPRAEFSDAWLIKTDSQGIEVWSRTYGGDADDWGYTVQQSADSGYMLVGSTHSSGAGEADIWLVKTDPDGVIEWEQTFGGAEHDYGYFVQQATDGGYILAGETYSQGRGASDVHVIKSDREGNLLWEQTFGDSADDLGYALCETSDRGFLITGFTSIPGSGQEDLWVIRIDGAGGMQWERIYDTSFGGVGRSIQQTTDGNFAAAGFLRRGDSSYDFWLIKADSAGNVLWDRTYGWNGDERAAAMQQTGDEGFILVGLTNSLGAGLNDIWLVKTDADGEPLWDQTYGGPSWDVGRSVQQTADGGYILVGTTQSFGRDDSDVWLLKTDANGAVVWSQAFNHLTDN